MASAGPRSSAPPRSTSSKLATRLAAALPKSHTFYLYHVSTPPTKTTALCSAPPGEREDRTYVEKHFLAVAIDANSSGSSRRRPSLSPRSSPPSGTSSKRTSRVLVMGLEVFVYSTAYSSIFFVSKADSTGYLHLVRFPKGTPSPIREVSSAFLNHLLESRRRSSIQSVVSLFARSQAQYLFPGSIENNQKHVLDDRGLIRWWCRVLNSLLQPPQPRGNAWGGIKGYLLVPGLDTYETRAFLPRTPEARSNWLLGHPLKLISHYHREYDWIPPSCLIPKFPDDPKSRFRDELDDETQSCTGTQTTGAWKSVRDLDQFWEMMAFRQECSSGQLTGFIWVVFDPVPSLDASKEASAPPSSAATTSSRSRTTPEPSNTTNHHPGHGASPLKSITGTPVRTRSPAQPAKRKRKPLTGVIVPRKPRVKTQKRNYLAKLPVSTPFYYWPEDGRGTRLVDERGYDNISKLLLRLDFASLDLAIDSTEKWVKEVGLGESWSVDVVGEREGASPPASAASHEAGPGVNNLTSLVKRKRAESGSAAGAESKTNVLGAGLLRKKPKGAILEPPLGMEDKEPKVHVLGAGLVRKKPKS